MNNYRFQIWQWFVLLLVAGLILSPIVAQESRREVNSSGLGALMGLALGKDLPSIGWAAGAGTAGAIIAVDAIDHYYSTDPNRNRPQPQAEATYRKVGPSQQTNQLEQIAAVQSAMGPENYLGYQALRT